MARISRVVKELGLLSVEEKHTEELYKLTDDNRNFLRQWLPWVDGTKSVDDTMQFIRSSVELRSKGMGFQFVIEYHERIAGMIGIHEITPATRKCEIGYWLAEEYNGKGIMTHCCRFVTDFSFCDIGMNKTSIKCATGNIKSQGIPRRLNYKEEGRLRHDAILNAEFVDHVLFAMLKEEWKK